MNNYFTFKIYFFKVLMLILLNCKMYIDVIFFKKLFLLTELQNIWIIFDAKFTCLNLILLLPTVDNFFE